MNHLHNVAKGHTKPLQDLLKCVTDSESEVSALHATALCRHVETYLENLRANLLAAANAEFKELQEKDPKKSKWSVGGMASVFMTSRRAHWDYPAEITELEEELRRKKKMAQLDKTATRVDPIEDPTKPGFSLALAEKFKE
jgi:hypothetical protein